MRESSNPSMVPNDYPTLVDVYIEVNGILFIIWSFQKGGGLRRRPLGIM